MMIISCIMLSAYAAIGWGFAHEVKSADSIRVDSGNYADFVDMVPISMANAVRAALWSAPEMKLMRADAYLVYRVGILRDGHKKAKVDATNSKVLKY
jgi:hypothetical protein